MNLNRVILVGRVTADPQARQTPSGQSVASFSIATNRIWTDKQGQRQEDTEFHNVVLWGKLAQIAGQYLAKGSEVLVEGRLTTRKWQDKQGNERSITEIVGESMQLGSKPQNKPQPAPQQDYYPEQEEIDPNSLPF